MLLLCCGMKVKAKISQMLMALGSWKPVGRIQKNPKVEESKSLRIQKFCMYYQLKQIHKLGKNEKRKLQETKNSACFISSSEWLSHAKMRSTACKQPEIPVVQLIFLRFLWHLLIFNEERRVFLCFISIQTNNAFEESIATCIHRSSIKCTIRLKKKTQYWMENFTY